MKDRLCISERRMKIIDFLVIKKQSTYLNLAMEFNVSVNTISRDIDYLSAVVPIYTKQGNQGGVYILPEFRSYKNYLTDDEEKCLYRMLELSSVNDKRILCGIITKFTRNIAESNPFISKESFAR